MSAARALPWDEVMAFGLGWLKLPPHYFWSTTPRELAAAMAAFTNPAGRAPPMHRERLSELMGAFPDR